ncbi:MAG: addiction module killer protein [Deltaproteobacteria bacterium RIFCSPHIGHO2_02_FULL_40_11]|nr:MAG: addiction module killer protein [Deltaproteobacteria bacterium RIFCSPHIGHO2_02_FULL_40_11]
MNVIPRELLEYEIENGRCPFSEWLDGLKDIAARAIIRKRLNRIRMGNFGNTRSVGEGVFELKIDFGPGYRVYYGLDGDTLVVLLCGGDKGSQERDIRKATEYWQDYRR